MNLFLLIFTFLALSFFIGCAHVQIPPEHQAAYDKISKKESRKWEFIKLGGQWEEAAVSFGYEILDRNQPWLDITFEEFKGDILKTHFSKIQTISQEETENYNGLWEFGQRAAAAIPFTRGLASKPSFRGIVTLEWDKTKDLYQKALQEISKREGDINKGEINRIGITIWKDNWVITPYKESGQNRVQMSYYDSTLGMSLPGPAQSFFFCNYDGHILKTIPERKKQTK